MKTSRVKLPKSVYEYFLLIRGSRLFTECVLNIVKNQSKFVGHEVGTEVISWYNKQEDLIHSLYLIQEYGMELEDEN